MHFSRPLRSSLLSAPSQDGRYLAAIVASKIVVHAVCSLSIIRTIDLPEAFSSSVKALLWSVSSDKLLLFTSETIKVFSITIHQFSASISNPTASTARPTHVQFGTRDTEVLVFSEFGLKLSIFCLDTSTSIELITPKFFTPATAARGLSIRANNRYISLLTRNGGKDVISIHKSEDWSVVRSWTSNTIDAQGLSWSADGKWLAVFESAGLGHKILIYTPDGHLFQTWQGPDLATVEDKDWRLGAGIKSWEWNPASATLLIGDHGSDVFLLSIPKCSIAVTLRHPAIIRPHTTLQIWQENLGISNLDRRRRTYSRCEQAIAPPAAAVSPATDVSMKSGIAMMTIDQSGTLVATRLENMPTAVWIWDLATRHLKAVLLQHAPVSRLAWHPTNNELLLVRCEGDDCRGIVYAWEPSWDTPCIVDFGSQLPDGEVMGKTAVSWLGNETVPMLCFNDCQDCILAALTDDEEMLPWRDGETMAVDIYGNMSGALKSVLHATKGSGGQEDGTVALDTTATWLHGQGSLLDDTFEFRKAA